MIDCFAWQNGIRKENNAARSAGRGVFGRAEPPSGARGTASGQGGLDAGCKTNYDTPDLKAGIGSRQNGGNRGGNKAPSVSVYVTTRV